jgi:hypothetical protein
MTLGEGAANGAVGALESVEAVDAAALKLAGAVTNAVPVGAARDALSGTWLGHALHPALTDVVIGSFFSATLLDLLGGDDSGRASEEPHRDRPRDRRTDGRQRPQRLGLDRLR